MKYLKNAISKLDKISSYNFKALLIKAWNDADFLVGWLEKEYGIKPVIVGGMAVQYYGYRRMTEDIDILISKEAYQKLEEDGKIKFGQLKIKPGIQIDVLTEGKDGNPDPEKIRELNSYYPTIEGLIYMKLISGRMKDQADIVELLKIHNEKETYSKVIHFIPEELREDFENLKEVAENEQT